MRDTSAPSSSGDLSADHSVKWLRASAKVSPGPPQEKLEGVAPEAEAAGSVHSRAHPSLSWTLQVLCVSLTLHQIEGLFPRDWLPGSRARQATRLLVQPVRPVGPHTHAPISSMSIEFHPPGPA